MNEPRSVMHCIRCANWMIPVTCSPCYECILIESRPCFKDKSDVSVSSASKDDTRGAINIALEWMCQNEVVRRCYPTVSNMINAAHKELSELMLAKDERDVRLRDIVELQRQLAAKDAEIERMKIDIADRDTQNIELGGALFKRDAELAHKVQMCVELSGLLDKALAENASLREVLKGVYDTLTRELAEPEGSETVAMVLCCTAIESALTGEKGNENADSRI
jgi:hypothetical protein